MTYKSLHESLDAWAIEELIGHYVNYRKADEGLSRAHGAPDQYPDAKTPRLIYPLVLCPSSSDALGNETFTATARRSGNLPLSDCSSDVGARKVVAFEEQRLIICLCQRITEAISEV